MKANKLPLVSIILPCYNHELYVQDCIKSIIEQSYQNIELIIIDDGSQDKSVIKIEELLNKCKERFIRFEFRHRTNQGLSATLNEAINWCNGEYLSCIASDDMLLPNKTKIQVNFLQNNRDIVAVFGGVKIIDNNNNVINEIEGTNEVYSFKDVILQTANILAPTQMIRLDLVRQAGGYDPKIAIEDWYMWLKLTQMGNIYCMREYFSLYRYHEDNTSKKVDIMYQARLQVLNDFKQSEFYDDAIREVEWLNNYESLVHVGQKKLYHFKKMIFLKPYKTINLSLNKTLKIVKKKFNK